MKDLLDKMKRLNENKNGKVVTFDFDNTIVKSFENNIEGEAIEYQFGGVNPAIIQRIKKFKDGGATVLVVTSRNTYEEVPQTSINTMLKQLNVQVDGVFYTNGELKAKKLYELGSSLHYDDDPREHEAIKEYANLHKNFNITVKDADELLSDIEEVAKGLIMTTDGKFIIVQRSDSHEWDAAGGHLLQGEKPGYAFYREVKEETGLKVSKVQLLDTKDTMWKKKNKLVYYFISTVPYTCQEAKAAIELQWELSDYFCGSLEEVEDMLTTPEGGTENLKNNLNSLKGADDLLMERDYQKTSQRIKSYKQDKAGLLDQGPNDKPYAPGIKNLKLPRGKSAPPGVAPQGGPMEEGHEDKKPSKIKIRFVRDIDEKKKRKNKYHWGVPGWNYGGGYGEGGSDGDGE